jgi:cytochrome P450
MRITTPPPGSRVRLDEINLADTTLYTHGDAHLAWQTLRAEQPVFWQSRATGRGFWAVTRWSDVRRVLAEYETFTSERGTAIAMLDGSDPAAGLMMQSTDPPRQRQFRQQLGRPFSSHAVVAYEEQIRSFVTRAMAPALDGEAWDAADSFIRLPMVVGAIMMGLPEADVDLLLRLAYSSLAPLDPHYGNGSEKSTSVSAHFEIIKYFSGCIAERRENRSADVISHLMEIQIDGRPMTDEELLLNCLSLLLGAVVTTSHAISATLIGLAEQNQGEGRWPSMMRLQSVVEEALRWSSPVTHFMRCARHDVEMSGTKIRAGDAVTAWIASANRDEIVFEEAYKLDLGRWPNRHITFGNGPHRCLGSHLARLMLRESFAVLIDGIESFELASAPRNLVSNEIAGIVSLPLRIKTRMAAAGRRGSS